MRLRLLLIAPIYCVDIVNIYGYVDIVNKGRDMTTTLITGGHAGIGLACSTNLATVPGMNPVLAGRSLERMEPVAQQLRTTHGITVKTLLLDVSSLTSVRSAVAELCAMLDDGDIPPLQAILCNAGGQFRGPISYSADGYEETFATNYLGHFLLSHLLLDRISVQGRIVFTASGTHDPDTADGRMVGKAAEPDGFMLANNGKNGEKPLSAGVRYSTSKLCMMLYAYELHRRLRRSGSSVASVAFDPGSIPETGLLRTMPKPVQWLAKTSAMKWVMRRMGVTQGSVGFSGGALARIATDPEFSDSSGKYLQSNDGNLIEARSSVASYDETKAARLWQVSQDLVNLQPNERPTVLGQT